MAQVCDESEKDYWFRRDATILVNKLYKSIQYDTVVMNRWILFKNVLFFLYFYLLVALVDNKVYAVILYPTGCVLFYAIFYYLCYYGVVDHGFATIACSIKLLEKPTIEDALAVSHIIMIRFGNDLERASPNYRKVWFVLYSHSVYGYYTALKLGFI